MAESGWVFGPLPLPDRLLSANKANINETLWKIITLNRVTLAEMFLNVIIGINAKNDNAHPQRIMYYLTYALFW